MVRSDSPIESGARLLLYHRLMSASLDLTDLDAWQERVPYDEFARLRRESPIAWFDEEPPNHGFWSVHRYADIIEISRGTKRFSSAEGISFEEPTEEDMAARRTIIDMDPPEHLAKWATNYGRLLQVLSRNFKDEAFAEEAEWRISTTLRNPRATDLHFRAGHFGIIPYSKIDFSDIAQLIVKKIVVSPTNYFSEAKGAVELRLIASGIDPGGVDIQPSRIPLRT
jgi:hypothetical protein